MRMLLRFVLFAFAFGALVLFLLRLTRNPRSGRGSSSGGNAPDAFSAEPESRYREALGLDGTEDEDQIRKRYRELLSRYHPDKVQHLGEEFRRMAEQKTREILEAYAYYSEKHGR